MNQKVIILNKDDMGTTYVRFSEKQTPFISGNVK